MRMKTFICLMTLLLALCLAATGTLAADKPNILVIMGDDIGYWNLSYNNRGMMGYQTPNIDSIANGGMIFTDYYAQQSCTAGRAAFITGQSTIRTGLTKVGMPGADVGLQAEDPTIAELLHDQGYATAAVSATSRSSSRSARRSEPPGHRIHRSIASDLSHRGITPSQPRRLEDTKTSQSQHIAEWDTDFADDTDSSHLI